MNLLEVYVQAWHDSASAITTLLPTLDESEWEAPTDCPGWTVKDVAAHLAHLENELATGVVASTDPSMTEMVSAYTQAGVEARRDHTTEELVSEFAEAVAVREQELESLNEDPESPAPVTPGGISWSWDTLLRNRAIDVWVHEQDIRRAVGKPGGMDSAGAQVTAKTFKRAMPFVVGKKVRPAPGTTVGWHVTGEIPFDLTVAVGDDGRAKVAPSGEREPQALLTMSTEAFTALGAGRRTADQLGVEISGDRELASTVLTAMPVTF
ncbi:maleylpyruvate isomerase family mycothiol-dependent enzyme [Aeromicrobium sp.]